MARFSLKDQSIIITGASSGIGKELALQYAKEGACLTLAARNKEKLIIWLKLIAPGLVDRIALNAIRSGR